MIRLNVNDYCHLCNQFEVSVGKLNSLSRDGKQDIIIECQFKKTCENIKLYLECGNVIPLCKVGSGT